MLRRDARLLGESGAAASPRHPGTNLCRLRTLCLTLTGEGQMDPPLGQVPKHGDTNGVSLPRGAAPG